MRIGMVTGEYPPMLGGVGAYTQMLARALRDQGHELSIFTRQEAIDSAESGIALEAVVGAQWGRQTHGQMRKWIAAWRPDVINIQFQTAAFNMLPAIHFSPERCQPLPVVVTFHDLRVPYLFPKAGPLRQQIVRRLARQASGVIATDEIDLHTLNGWGIGHTRWIPIGSNITPCRRPEHSRKATRARLAIPEEALLIAYFGFLNESKGALVLIEALDRLREQGIDAQALMIGDLLGASDPANRAYAERVAARIAALDLGEAVHWTGYASDEEVTASFDAADLVALPYLDGVSLRRGTLMAALVHGKAIVSTQVGAMPPSLDGALELCTPGDPPALANSIFNLWQDPLRRQQLETRALLASQQFTWEAIAVRCVDFYGSMPGGSRA